MFGFLKDIVEWFWPTKPWRGDFEWNKQKNDALLKELHQLQPKTKQNILIIGLIGAGKSSFIKSVQSIDKGREYGMAMTGDLAVCGSWTRRLAEYSNDGLLKGYRLLDCSGIEPSNKGGYLVDDLLLLIKGHICTGYKFNQDKPINENDDYYKSKPTIEDQMHCVIFAVCAKSVKDGLPAEYVQRIQKLQKILRDRNIPRIMILTKVDLICNEVATDETKMFKSSEVHQTVKIASELFGIEMASIHPVVNYVNDYNIRHEMNIPILLALRQAMHYSNDRVEYNEQENSDDSRKKNRFGNLSN